VLGIDDLIERSTKQFLRLSLLPWPHQTPPLITARSRESRLQIRGSSQHEFARKPAPRPQCPVNPIAALSAMSNRRSNTAGYVTDDYPGWISQMPTSASQGLLWGQRPITLLAHNVEWKRRNVQ
jgi:hypothetical protein